MYKKIIGLVFGLVLVFGFAVSANASYNATFWGTDYVPDINNCVDGGFNTFYCSPDYLYPSSAGSASWKISDSISTYPYTFIGTMQNVVITNWTAEGQAVVGCMDEEATNYNANATEDETPTLCEYEEEEGGGVSVIASGIKFFPDDPETQENTANVLTASVGGAVVSTTGNLLPVLAVVGGILLAFVGIRFIVSLLYGTESTKNKKNRV